MGINQAAVFLRLKNKYLKLVVTAISVIGFISVYSICNFFYPNNDEESILGWWHLKNDLYMLVVLLWVIIAKIKSDKHKSIDRVQKIIEAIGIGYGLANFIDRRFFHDRDFGYNDLFIVLIIVFVSQINLKKIL